MTGFKNSLIELIKFDSEKERSSKANLIFFSAMICMIAVFFAYRFVNSEYVGEVFKDYFPYADAIMNGVAPYQPYNGLRWEYPPLAYVFIFIPRLFTSDPYVYTLIYIVMITFFILLCLFLIRKIAMDQGRNAKFFMMIYLISIIFLMKFYFDRFDIIVALTTVGAVYLYSKKKYNWAIFLLVIGMFIKIYPGLLIPFFIIPMIANRDWKTVRSCVLVVLFSSILLIMPFAIMSPDTFYMFITYHSSRGIQLESFASSFILVFESLGLTYTETVSSHGSFNLEGGITEIVSSMVFPVLIMVLVVFALSFCISCKKMKLENWGYSMMPLISVIVVMAFIIFNKVFSAQYMVWIIGLLIPALIFCCNDRDSYDYSVLFLFAVLITFLIVLSYTGLCEHVLPIVIIFAIRNILVVSLFILLIKKYFDASKYSCNCSCSNNDE